MTRTQWRRYQRYTKTVVDDYIVDPKGKQKVVKIAKRPVKERLSLPHVEGNPVEDNEMNSDFMDSEPNFDNICNVVFILPTEYEVVSEVEELEDYSIQKTWRNTDPSPTM